MTTAALTAVFLVATLTIMSHESKNVQLAVISACIFVLALLVSHFLKVLSFKMLAVTAAYAAVLDFFASNVTK
jgi:hypothetical protein